jgi:hypothetical protein
MSITASIQRERHHSTILSSEIPVFRSYGHYSQTTALRLATHDPTVADYRDEGKVLQ